MNDVNSKCTGDTDEHIQTITRIVNGGLNGLADRTAKFRKILGMVGGTE
jgi:predicted chitinase